MLRTMGGWGETDGDGETEEDFDIVLSGEDDRGVGGSEDVREDKDGMLDVELWDGVGVRRRGEEFDDGDDSSW